MSKEDIRIYQWENTEFVDYGIQQFHITSELNPIYKKAGEADTPLSFHYIKTIQMQELLWKLNEVQGMAWKYELKLPSNDYLEKNYGLIFTKDNND